MHTPHRYVFKNNTENTIVKVSLTQSISLPTMHNNSFKGTWTRITCGLEEIKGIIHMHMHTTILTVQTQYIHCKGIQVEHALQGTLHKVSVLLRSCIVYVGVQPTKPP